MLRPRPKGGCFDAAPSRHVTTAVPTAKRRRLEAATLQARARPIALPVVVAAAATGAAADAAPSSTRLPSPEQFDAFEAVWLAERVRLSLGRTPAAWALRDVEVGRLPCDARMLIGRARALAASAAGGGAAPRYDGRALLQAHPAALALDAEELRVSMDRVMQLLPGAAREDPTALAMAALSPLVMAAASEESGGGDSDGAAERVALAYEELGALVAASAPGLSMGPRLFAWLFAEQQQEQRQAAIAKNAAPPCLATGVRALAAALGGVELASAALERAPELVAASEDSGELLSRIEWLRYRLGIGTMRGDEEDDDDELFVKGAAEPPPPPVAASSSSSLLLPARLAAALSTASNPDAAAGRSFVSPARSNPKDPADLPIRSPEALTREEFAGAPPEHAAGSSSPLAVPSVAALDARAAAAARVLGRHAGWPPGAAIRFLRASPGALAWDWSRGGACDVAFSRALAAAGRRGGRWPLALRTSPAAVAAALAAPARAQRRLAYLAGAPGALPGVGLRRALAMPEVDFLEACPGYRVWRLRRRNEEEGGGGSNARRSPPASSDLILLGDLRAHDRML